MAPPSMKEAIVIINTIRPKYVFLTAKSGAGKTYFSNQLRGYKVLELDNVVRSTGEQFGIKGSKAFSIYKNAQPPAVMKAFVARVHSFFQYYQKFPIVVEGAISDASLITRIFSGPYTVFTFVFLFPVNVNAYAARMMKRFKEEKKKNVRSLSIWPDVTPELAAAPFNSTKLKQFMLRMSRDSKAKSKERFDYFTEHRFTIFRVNV